MSKKSLTAVFPIIASVSLFFILVLIFKAGFSNNWSIPALRYFVFFLIVSFILSGFIYYSKNFFARLALLLFSLIFLIVGIGGSVFFSAALFFLSSFFLGRCLFGKLSINGENNINLMSSLMLGMGVYIFGFGFLIFTPYNTKILYLLILTLPVFMYFFSEKLLAVDLANFEKNVSSFIAQVNGFNGLHFFLALSIFVYMASHNFFPTVMSDENAMHLSLWTQLKENHKFSIDVYSQVWSVAPITVGMVHGIISLLSDSDARGGFNFILLVLITLSVYRLTKLILSNTNDRLLVVSLFLSTPLIANLLLGIQTDLFLSFLLTSGCLILFSMQQKFAISDAMGLLIVGAIAISAKLPALLIGAGFFVPLCLTFIKQPKGTLSLGVFDWFKVFFILIFVLCLAFFPYFKAWYITGNPVFPLYNGIFKSVFFDPINFIDMRWSKGANLYSYFGLFFNTSSFFESKNFVAGFQYFLLFPIALIAIIALRIKNTLIIVIPLLFYVLPMFFALQYLRYFFAALPLISVLLGVFLLPSNNKKYRKITVISFYGYILVNIIFLPGISWVFYDSPLSFYNDRAKTNLITRVVPEQILSQNINYLKHDPRVLFDLDRSYGATLAGTPFYNTWYSPKNAKEINAWDSSDSVQKSLSSWRIDFVYWDLGHPYKPEEKQRNILRNFLVDYGNPQSQVGSLLAYKISAKKINYENILLYQGFTSLADFNVSGSPKILAEDSLSISTGDVLAKSFNVGQYSAFKYNIRLKCEGDTDQFVAQVNWDIGSPYYKLINCNKESLEYFEVGLIPQGASIGILYLSARSGTNAILDKIAIGVR